MKLEEQMKMDKQLLEKRKEKMQRQKNILIVQRHHLVKDLETTDNKLSQIKDQEKAVKSQLDYLALVEERKEKQDSQKAEIMKKIKETNKRKGKEE